MTEQQARSGRTEGTASGVRTDRSVAYSEPGTGWVRFAGVVMAVVGAFGVIEGFIALFSPTYFVTVSGTVLAVDLSAWAWLHLAVGALTLVTGLSLLGAAPNWARGVGIGLVALNMLVQLAWLPAYPVWSIMVIILDLVIISALAMTWNDRITRVS
ncbi:DUF7144 family membrane protein [Actinomycetospora chiangmaiensis]|uniref:DUF7144 family membrane protein n=1 Tax=Actinomycetospora chiangmaiensis TaxID=402650 RepID=UPI00036B10E3|nr:hypothetical protein [Actinomycetospora chiangmaiensis]